jgi:hypothetical protein
MADGIYRRLRRRHRRLDSVADHEMKASDWTHNCCFDCWNKREPNRQPVCDKTLVPRGIALICCWCGIPTQSGIYVREDPTVMPNCQHNVEVIVPRSRQDR